MTHPLVLTAGDPAGIGPEIAAKAWAELRQGVPFALIGDPRALAAHAPDIPCQPIARIEEAAEVFPTALPLLVHEYAALPIPGIPDLANAPATMSAIAMATTLCMEGEASGVVTNPISKQVLIDGAGFAYPGHTEYLAHLAGVPMSVMLLAAPALKVVPVTIHIPLSEVPQALSAELLTETIRITARAMTTDFGIAAPRIAVAGLNPHAGEGGKMGREEIDLILPCIEALRGEGFRITGPLSADTMFHETARAGYDVAIGMYHDQALIPIKTLDFAGGVNCTLGLPFVRTSPDHGTAFDIAGQGKADPQSLIAAIRMAGEMAERRGTHDR